MAEPHLKGIIADDVELQDGHKIIYLFNVHRLDLIQRTFYPSKYNIHCTTLPTSWEVHVKYHRREEGDNEPFTFTVKLKRIDSSVHRVKASIYAKFHDAHCSPVLYPLTYSRDRIVPGDEVEHSLEDIQPEVLATVASVDVVITIQNCHTNRDFHNCAPFDNTDKNNLILSKL